MNVLVSRKRSDKESEYDYDPPKLNDQFDRESTQKPQVNLIKSEMSPQEQAEQTEKLIMLKLDMPQEQKEKLKKLIKVNADIFALESTELGSTDIVTHGHCYW